MTSKAVLVFFWTETITLLCLGEQYVVESNYDGRHFPTKYLVPDATIPTKTDLTSYLTALTNCIEYFYDKANDTDGSGAIGLYLSKAMLKKILLDYPNKLKVYQTEIILNAIEMAEYTLSHYIYMHVQYDSTDLEYRFSKMLLRDEEFINSIRELNENRLKPWLLQKTDINNFIEQFDNISLPKETYVELVDATESEYYIRIDRSDVCLSHIYYHIVPPNPKAMLQPCAPDPFCKSNLLSTPSVAYTLSHRFLNMFLLQATRRCYLESEYEDNLNMDMLCAQMYRETVYLARRGFFFRDIFLEHIALCSFLGYKEFHRPQWYRKALSWIKDEGCMAETRNFWYNRTASRLRNTDPNDGKEINKLHEALQVALQEYCHSHPTVLLLVVITHAIRYILNFLYT